MLGPRHGPAVPSVHQDSLIYESFGVGLPSGLRIGLSSLWARTPVALQTTRPLTAGSQPLSIPPGAQPDRWTQVSLSRPHPPSHTHLLDGQGATRDTRQVLSEHSAQGAFLQQQMEPNLLPKRTFLFLVKISKHPVFCFL